MQFYLPDIVFFFWDVFRNYSKMIFLIGMKTIYFISIIINESKNVHIKSIGKYVFCLKKTKNKHSYNEYNR